MAVQAGPSLEGALRAGAEALGLSLDDVAIQRLLRFLALLEKWNRVHNLTAVRQPMQMLEQHVLDCLAVIGPLRRHTAQGAARLLDVGSGGGLPGVVIACCCPEIAVICVDSVQKKTAFLNQVRGQLALKNLEVVHARVQDLDGASFDVVISRAFASMADFVSWSQGALSPDGVWIAMKGRYPEQELAALPDSVTVFHVEPLRVPRLKAERCLIWLRKR